MKLFSIFIDEIKNSKDGECFLISTLISGQWNASHSSAQMKYVCDYHPVCNIKLMN